MTLEECKALDLPDVPGVYTFLDGKGKILYIGKATSLRDRVASYFRDDILHTRGKHIADMVTIAATVRVAPTTSVLEALVLEAARIKEHAPPFNTKEKDNKSFNFIVVTDEPFPRVLIVRERLLAAQKGVSRLGTFGPFPSGGQLRAMMKIIRRIFPYRDRCTPGVGKPCFHCQLGLCPGVCTGAISSVAYRREIKGLLLFLEGKKDRLFEQLTRHMHAYARKEEFESAAMVKHQLDALQHIRDVALMTDDVRAESGSSARFRERPFRIEAFDIAHIQGTATVGAMAVVLDGDPAPEEYRRFSLPLAQGADDILHLRTIVTRRVRHTEWDRPDLVVADGSLPQKRAIESVFREAGWDVPVVAVVKDEHHKPKAILGKKELVEVYRVAIARANAEVHRFAIAYHRTVRTKRSGIPRAPKQVS